MEIERLREYIELSRRLNFTAAAKGLHLAQPTLSNHIRALEREAGSELVERSNAGGTRLTPAGQRFLEMAQQVVEAYDDAMSDLRDLARDVEGRVTVRMPRREYSRALVDYTYEFQAEHPNIEMVLAPWVAEDGYADVLSGKIDCAYVGQAPSAGADGGAAAHPGVREVAYGVQEAVLWVGAAHPLAQKAQLTVADLDGCRLAIAANQKNDSWRATMHSVADDCGISIALDERYCDSLEDFLMNKVGPGDLVLNYRDLFDMPGIAMKRDHALRSFEPPLMLRMCVAYADRDDNPALQAFARFLAGKFEAAG